MPHTLILGMTGSGKTTLAVEMARKFQTENIPVLVCDPSHYKGNWGVPEEHVFYDPHLFKQIVFMNTRCACFVDEAGEVIGRHPGELQSLATRSRHLGHNMYFICQGYTQIGRTFRDQCRDIITFRQGARAARDLAEDYADKDLLESATLEPGEYLAKFRHGKVERGKIF